MNTITDIREVIKSTPLSQLVGQYISLKKRGQNFEGLCPFHNDKNPSLKINDQKGLFKCFVCGASGDAIGFVEKFKNLDFKEAISELADQLGLDTSEINQPQKVDLKLNNALKIISVASKIYRKYATEKSPPEYNNFLQRRKITELIAEQFQLGHAPSHNILVHYLETLPEGERDKIIQLAVEIGIIKQGHSGYYDTFRERIVFPIWDHLGVLRGFGSRVINDQKMPKYLNSQDSTAFSKGSILYGFHIAKKHIRSKERVILTEGYMDTITFHQFNYLETVAVMGIAMSEQCIQQIIKITTNVYFALDNDDAGLKAMNRINELFLKKQVIPKFIDMSPHKDPDEFLHQQGFLQMEERIKGAQNFIDHVIAKQTAIDFGANMDKKLQALQKIFQLLMPLGMSLNATEKIISAAKKIGLTSTVDVILDSYKEFIGQHQQDQSHYKQIEIKKQSLARIERAEDEQQQLISTSKNQANSLEDNPNSIANSELTKEDVTILKEVLLHPGLLDTKGFTEILNSVKNNEVKLFLSDAARVFGEVAEDEFVSIILDLLHNKDWSSQLKKYVHSTAFSGKSEKLNTEILEKVAIDLKNKMEIARLEMQKKDMSKKYKETNDELLLKDLLTKIHHVSKQIDELKQKKK